MLRCKPSPMPNDILKQFANVRASLEQERTKLQAQLKEIEAALSGEVPAVKAEVRPPARAKPKMSAAARARITAGTKAMWENRRAAKAAFQAALKHKPTMSARGKANIRAAQKARWAKIRAAKGQTVETKPLPKGKQKISPEAGRKMVAGGKAAKAKAAK
jgi:hypothetical protein